MLSHLELIPPSARARVAQVSEDLELGDRRCPVRRRPVAAEQRGEGTAVRRRGAKLGLPAMPRTARS
jgi:hypothetical protein